MKSLGLSPTEQEVVDMQCEVEKKGRIFFPDFCKLCLRKFREFDEENFRQIMFKVSMPDKSKMKLVLNYLQMGSKFSPPRGVLNTNLRRLFPFWDTFENHSQFSLKAMTFTKGIFPEFSLDYILLITLILNSPLTSNMKIFQPNTVEYLRDGASPCQVPS